MDGSNIPAGAGVKNVMKKNTRIVFVDISKRGSDVVLSDLSQDEQFTLMKMLLPKFILYISLAFITSREA